MTRTHAVVALAVVVGLSAPALSTWSTLSAQSSGAPPGWTLSRTSWGDPDLQGIYTNKDESGIPFERPGEFDGQRLADVDDRELADLIAARQEAAAARAPGIGGADTGAGPPHWYENFGATNSRAWLVIDPPDGRIPPMTDEAQQRPPSGGGSSFGDGPWNGPEDFSSYDRCISRGLPGSMMPAIYGNAYQIVQSPGFVAIRYEMIHETRIVPLGGSASLTETLSSHMGDARGHWDGDTLVIETTNFREGMGYRGANAKALRLVERFTPVGPDRVEWSVTVNDPTTWVRPWTFAMNLTRDATQAPFEYACHEGNRGLPNILSASRVAEREAGN
jgi:hypothetical protein